MHTHAHTLSLSRARALSLTHPEQEFAEEKNRERYMRDLTEATCSRVLWFGIFTLIMLVGTR